MNYPMTSSSITYDIEQVLKSATLVIFFVRNVFHLLVSAATLFTFSIFAETYFGCFVLGNCSPGGAYTIYFFLLISLYNFVDNLTLPQDIYYIWATTVPST